MVSANGQPLDIRGKCELQICIDGVNVVHSVLVAVDVTQDCLVGIDFLSKQSCTIDFEAKALIVEGNIVKLKAKSGVNKVFRTRCFRKAYTGLPVVRITENQKALNCVVLNYSIPVSEE